MRRLVGNALEAVCGLHDPLPLELRAKYRLMSRGAALSCIHFPHAMDEVAEARRRLVYEELLLLELMLMRESRERTDGCEPVVHAVDGPRMAALAEAVPFRLTDEQEEAKRDILAALAAPQTANHLLLGDVGTGKTVVAAFALAAAADTGAQALLMAPTEVLARQHGKSLGPLFDAAGISWAVLTLSLIHICVGVAFQACHGGHHRRARARAVGRVPGCRRRAVGSHRHVGGRSGAPDHGCGRRARPDGRSY